MRIYNRIWITLVFCTLLPLQCWALQGFVFADLGTGHVTGLAQTPKGGSPGTTSMHRPMFSEVHLNNDAFYELGAGITHRDYLIQFYYIHLDPHGNTTLTQDLLTHAQLIPQGSKFNMKALYDWYIIELAKAFRFKESWRLSPLIDMNWVKYGYHFWASPFQSSRCFTVFNVTFGLKLEYDFTSCLSAYAEGKFTFPTSNLQIYMADLGLHYRYRVTKTIELMPSFAVGLMSLDYEDEQPVPNHIRYTNFPYAKIELQLNIG